MKILVFCTRCQGAFPIEAFSEAALKSSLRSRSSCPGGGASPRSHALDPHFGADGIWIVLGETTSAEVSRWLAARNERAKRTHRDANKSSPILDSSLLAALQSNDTKGVE